MNKKNFILKIIIILIIFIVFSREKTVIEKVNDSSTNYRIFKQINSNYKLHPEISIIYNVKTSKMDFYYRSHVYGKKVLIRDVEKIMYLETYIPPYSQRNLLPDEWYESVILVLKNNRIKIFHKDYIGKMTEQRYLEYSSTIKKNILKRNEKLVKPFIPKLHTPKEFYETYKDYFVPYYLADYEVENKWNIKFLVF